MSKQAYHTLCQSEENISLFVQDWWLDATCGPSNWDVLLIERNSRMVAAWPLYMPLNGVVSMPPYTQTMGIWMEPAPNDAKYGSALGARQSLCKLLIEKLQARAFMQRFDYDFTDWLPFFWKGFTQTTRYTYLLKNLADSDMLWQRLSHQTRRNIKKARDTFRIAVRQGVATDDFLRVQADTFERQHARNTQDNNVLRRLIEVCRQRRQGEIWGGYDESGQLHAAVFVVWQKRSAYYLAGGGDSAFRHSGAHALSLWEAIRCVSEYTDTFDFEGSMLPGVERFFREFGGIQTPYFLIQKGKPTWLDRAFMKYRRCLQKR